MILENIQWDLDDYNKEGIELRKVEGEKDTKYVYISDMSKLTKKTDNFKANEVINHKIAGGFLLDGN